MRSGFMKRFFLILGVCLLAPLSSAQAAFEEGVHYIEIPFSESLYKKGGKVEVREFFLYTCPYCFQLEPRLKSWLKTKPKYVNFVATPGSHNTVHAKTYYSFKAIGKLKKLHVAFFNSIHVDNKKYDDMYSIAKFVKAQGEDEAVFRKSFDSFSVNRQAKQAALLAQKYGVRNVPTLIIDGRFLTGARMAGSFESMLKLAEHLSKMIIKGKK